MQKAHLLIIALFATLGLFGENKKVQQDELTIRLEDPTYIDGVLTCDKGVLVNYPGLKIQARKIEYIRKKTEEGFIHKLKASGDLLVDFNNHFYVGETVEYDFVSETGFVTKGITCIERVYIGADRFIFHSNKTISIENLYVTTSGDKNYIWNFHAKSGTLNDKFLLRTDSVTFRIANCPVFYLPTYTSQFKNAGTSPFSYNLYWETGQGPMISARARLYSNETLKVYSRVDYRLQRGFATAFETIYEDPNRSQSFKTRNFYAYDTFYNDNNPNKMASRYRLQGLYDGKSKDQSTEMFVRWDRLSDRNMQGDFTFQNFELNTLMRTEAWVRKRDDLYNASIYARPRINPYQGFMQELPTVNLRFRPLTLGNLGLIMNNHFTGSFLDYAYSNNIDHLIPNFHSGRFQLESELYRPIYLPFLTFTPTAGINGIFYSQMTNNQAGMQLVGTYGAKLSSSWAKNFSSFQHTFNPYFEYIGLTSPTIKVGTPPIFSIADGLNKINELKFGFSNSLYFLNDPFSDPRFGLDVYGIAFFDAFTFSKTVPKGGFNFQINYPRVSFESLFGWNFQENVVDFANFTGKWTPNRYYAFSLEMRHRGRFYWKKDEQNNFILDVTRPISQLVNSNLSDNRNTILARMQLQLAPQWRCQIENHTGWARDNQPAYNESKIDLYTIVATMWELRASFMHTVRANEFSFGISMVPGK
jgi:hypothetical protein